MRAGIFVHKVCEFQLASRQCITCVCRTRSYVTLTCDLKVTQVAHTRLPSYVWAVLYHIIFKHLTFHVFNVCFGCIPYLCCVFSVCFMFVFALIGKGFGTLYDCYMYFIHIAHVHVACYRTVNFFDPFYT